MANHILALDIETTTVEGTFFRHSTPDYACLTGSKNGGRWAAAQTFCVLYLGRPLETVIAEAYRHLVDSTEGMRPEHVKPRVCLTCQVRVSAVADLRSTDIQQIIGLSEQELVTNQYTRCQEVGFQLYEAEKFKGILAPSATGIGETLVIFKDRLGASDVLSVIKRETWEHLPKDPRENSN